MQLIIEPEELRPLLKEVVAELADEYRHDDKLLWTEKEVGAMLGVRSHVVRDERLRGNLSGCRVGKRIMYSRKAILDFIERKEQEPGTRKRKPTRPG